MDSYIWFELYGAPSDHDVHLIGSVFQAWYVMADYEELRRRKLENRQKRDKLKLSFLSASLRPATPTPSPRKLAKRKSAPTGEGVIVKVRRSSRVANLALPNYKEVETKFFYIERAPISSYQNMENRVYVSDEAMAYTTERAENIAEKLEPRYLYFCEIDASVPHHWRVLAGVTTHLLPHTSAKERLKYLFD